MCASLSSIERGMILEEEAFLRSIYLPFSVGESGGRTLFERTSPADGGRKLANGRALPVSTFPKAEHLLKSWNTRWSNWP